MGGECLLVIDDNPANLKLIRVLMQAAGFQIKTAANAEAALVLLKTFRPRLILMDLQLPGMDGLTLTRQLKSDAATRDIKILALTAYAMKGDAEKARMAGCDDYITKPIDTRTLASTVARHLAELP